ncbi:MAG: hypothetical protein Unbinned338contig1000_24 [Prokaryotic dsDNA virus sp.]|nr:MAG: hypothetical protein Unbinned338contig1000_24 [Prokaryotic dsDNA virus sp.]|tara:strand:+ start:8949 stop:9215 length:267 start_codon:yes stop_codon:yes gene_type:complete
MKYFSICDEAQAIVHSKGVYRQVPVYIRDSNLYAKHGGGFIRLAAGCVTSSPNVRWSEIDTPHGEWSERGHMVIYKPHAVAPILEAAE